MYWKVLIFASYLFCNSCTNDISVNKINNLGGQNENWYLQTKTDLGASIKMIDENNGFAISRGRGNIPGIVYKYDGSQWSGIHSFPYSDFPIVFPIDSSTVWTVNHLTHSGDYKPIFNSIAPAGIEELVLPKVMWDEKDFSMWKSLDRLKDGTAWMVGQLGNILYFNGNDWIEYQSPLKDLERSSMFSVDLNDIKMIDESYGWAIGKNGIILKYENKTWKVIESPTKNDLYSINFSDEKNGWIAGEKGTILKFEKGKWLRIKTKYRDDLRSIEFDKKEFPWICGDNSRLIRYDGSHWVEHSFFQDYKDDFLDLDIIYTENGMRLIWIMGTNGIYTNAHGSQLSFSDITQSAALKSQGVSALISDQDMDGFPDLLVINEGPNLYFRNNGNSQFSDQSIHTGFLTETEYPNAMVADINNDGYQDVFEISDSETFRLLLGTRGFDFISFNGIQIKQDTLSDFVSTQSVSFVDFDNDGNLDLYISNYDDPNFVLKGDGSGNFQDITASLPVNKIGLRSFGAVFSDMNSDGLIDIIIPYRDNATNGRFVDLFVNEKDFKFSRFDSPSFFNSQQNDYIKSAIAEDFNNDGFCDLLFFNQDYQPVLLQNDGNAKFINVSDISELPQKMFYPEEISGIINSADLNNDGWMDLVLGGRIFLNNPEMNFKEVTENVGIHFMGTPSIADIDRDGDMDIFFGSSAHGLGEGKRAALYRNNINNKQSAEIVLKGDVSNRQAIGSQIYLYAIGESGDTVYTSLKQVGLGSSPTTINRLNQTYFGLDPDYNYQAQVIFPSGKTHILKDVSPGKNYTLYESEPWGHYFVLFSKDVFRSWQLYKPAYLWGVLLLVILFPAIIILSKKYCSARSIRYTIHFTFALVAYLITLHFSILMLPVFVITIPTLVASLILIALILGNNFFEKQKSTRYISHFKIDKKIGEGGMGRVYKALDIQTKKTVALKVLLEELLQNPVNRKRFDSECQILESLKHPNIVEVFEASESGYSGYIAMELLEGGTLRQFIHKHHPLSEKSIAEFLVQICSGLEAIHKNDIIHRDLKTNNIMLDSDNNLRIMDFGLSKAPVVSTMTNIGTAMGTLAYIAPEQITGLQIDKRSDFFSLGVIIYELFTNALPFNAENEMGLIHAIFNYQPLSILKKRSDINPGWELLVNQCLEKDFEKRPINITIISDKIKEIISG
ncbi:MAG: protein kinase [Calditrichaeota bacterium]|nr:protein kinase [Calditrichota bacterium]